MTHGETIEYILDNAALSHVLTALHRDLADDFHEPPAIDDALAACVLLGLSGSRLVVTEEPPPASQPMTVSAFGMQAARRLHGRLPTYTAQGRP